MDFDKYLDLLLEGGAAMKASRISVENIKSTFDRYKINVIKKIDPRAKYKTVGSLGKKVSSGDIDVAISTELDLQTVSDKLKELGVEHIVNKSLKQIYTEYPIYNKDGKETGDKVQVDLMFGDVDLLSSTYWAPGESHSKYKGQDITLVFSAMTRYTPIHEIKSQENKEALKKFKKEYPDLTYSYVYDISGGIFIKVRWMKELESGKNKGQMTEKSDRLPGKPKLPIPEATTVQEILDIWNTDSKVKWTKEDYSLPLEKVWKKAKQAFTSDKLRNIMDYTNNALEDRPKLESKTLNTIFMELMNESL